MVEAIAIGASAGGFQAVTKLIPMLPRELRQAVFVVQHKHEESDSFMASHLDDLSSVRVKDADEKEEALPGTVYLAPAGYHLLVEDDRTLSLSSDPPVNYSRPSIDVLFESAADVYGAAVAGVVLTGSGSDGAAGLRSIEDVGGIVIVQDPEEADHPSMPEAASAATENPQVLSLERIGMLLKEL